MNSDLSFEAVNHFFARRRALRDFSIRCPAGTVTCLIGPNGAGKSTALALAAGLLRSSSGRIAWGRRAIDPCHVPETLAYLPQQSAFPDVLAAGEVLAFAASARRAGAEALREIVAAAGLEPVLGLKVGQLSGGWVRRLGLAAALVPPSELLLLDEPFAGLDPETLDRLVEYLRRRAREGAVVVFASHDFEVIDQFQPRLAVLDEGAIAARADGVLSRSLYRQTLAAEMSAHPERIAHAC